MDVDVLLCKMHDNAADPTALIDCCKVLRLHLEESPLLLAELDSRANTIIRMVMNAVKVHVPHAAFQVQAYWLLFRLCGEEIRNQVHFVNEGCIDATIQVMQMHKRHMDVQMETGRLLAWTL